MFSEWACQDLHLGLLPRQGNVIAARPQAHELKATEGI